jgi:uncharacterized protein with PIN domain
MSAILAAKMRKLGWDVLTTHQAQKCASSDLSQVRFARQQGRVLVTRNYAHFMNIHNEFLETGEVHAGIVVCFWRSSVELLHARLAEALQRIPAESWTNLLQLA